MPYAKNKFIINHGGLRSFWRIIKGWAGGLDEVMDSASFLGDEMEENDLLQDPEALAFLAEQELDCAEIDSACERFIKAQAKFHSRQMDRNDRMRRWIDKKLAQQKQP